MPGIAFLNKKEFHTGSFRMIEKVWQAEKAQAASEQLRREHDKLLAEERYEEQLRRDQVQAGLLPPAALERMDWMYNHQSIPVARNLAEEYLLGRPVDAALLDARRPEAKESFVSTAGEDFVRRVEDPLLRMRAGERRGSAGDGLLVSAANRPRRFDESEDEAAPFVPARHRIGKAADAGRSREVLERYLDRHMGGGKWLGGSKPHRPARPAAAVMAPRGSVPRGPAALPPVDCRAVPANILREMSDCLPVRRGSSQA